MTPTPLSTSFLFQIFQSPDLHRSALCHHFNVYRAPLGTSTLPQTFDMPVLRDAHMPSHVVAVTQANSPAPPLMLPIDATLYAHGFRVDLAFPTAAPGTTSPVPRALDPSSPTSRLVVTLPVVPLAVPHAPSLPLLFLFGLGLEQQPNTLAWRLLPAHVVEEFPNAAAMAQVLARTLRDDKFEALYRMNHGMWCNVLALGLRNTRIAELVQTVWNVTAEARKIRQRAGLGRQ
ncbi:hypothetical protein Hypma_001300 [Hypsizygus marmoreus]|uniref:Uncharacterized protein n=1 Tax=Hypsizygus marmoreus TaxID=39966 RepID=A0A369K491_HYPMA|nr:hypothetical protein Hypma_001300 [Hypsizygus marmoreus]